MTALSALVIFLAGLWCAIDWPKEESKNFPGGIVLRDSTGRILRVALGRGDIDCRAFYEANENDWIVKALIAVEDGEFWEHKGIRPLSFLRAFAQNLLMRRRVSGGSTITMQTVRLIKPHRKSYYQKLLEAIRAVKMERERDKLWILSQYLNRAPFGSNLVGVESAAQGWFGKGAKELDLAEASMLAGMVQAPSRFRPDRGYEKALRRRDCVLKRMYEKGYITEEEWYQAAEVRPRLTRAPRPFLAPYYCDWFLTKAKKGDNVTALDPRLEESLERILNMAEEDENCTFAGMIVSVKDGAVLALDCSGDYFGAESGMVNAALAPRSAGSTLKPFLARQALKLGVITGDSMLDDNPIEDLDDDYHPRNFDGFCRGKVSLKEALVSSLNLPFVRLCREIGPDKFGNYLRSLGFRHMKFDNDRYGLGMAIGNVEVTLEELAMAYRSLAYASKFDSSAHLITEMLSGEERSLYAHLHQAQVKLPRFAWKTGTSSGGRDAWTVCWNSNYVVAVWAGKKRGGGDDGLIGAQVAAPVAWKIIRSIYARSSF